MDVDAPTIPEVDVVHADPDAPADDSLETSDEVHGASAAHDHMSDNRYIVIALILGVITAGEVAASYLDLGPVFIPLLLSLMAIKFFIVASFFMHLRFDNRLFSMLFYLGIALALVVYGGALLTFRFFES